MDLLSRDAKRQREALLSIICGEVAADAIAAKMPEAFRPEWDRAWAEVRPGAESDADALVLCIDQIRRELRLVRATAKRASEIGERPSSPSVSEIEDLRVKIARARSARAQARDASERRARETRARQDAAESLPSLRASLERLRAEADQRAREAAAAQGLDLRAAEAAANLLASTEELVRKLAQTESVKCTACGGHPPEDGWTARLDRIHARLGEIKIDVGRARAVAQVRSGDDPLGRAEKAVAAAEEILAARISAEVIAVAPDENEIGEWEAWAYESEQSYARLVTWDAQAHKIQEAEGRVDVLRALEKAANRAVASALSDPVGAFCARATEALGASAADHVAIQLFDGAKRVCRVGVQRGDGPVRSWRALSGAERTALIAAFASAWGASRSDAVRVVICDETWLDANALVRLCAALRRSVESGAITQAIVCAVTDYGCELPGWRVERIGSLGAAEAEGLTARAADGTV